MEPITLAELKDWLKIDVADEDALLAAAIAAARLGVEAASGRKLVTQTWRLVLNAWPPSPLSLPVTPVQAVSAIRVFNAANVATTVATAVYQFSGAFNPPQLALLGAVPAPGRPLGGIEIDMTAGYGAAAATVPEALRMAVRLFAAHLYENRGDGAPGVAPTPMPAAVAALVAPYRRARL
ncbi:hypothetical protein GCM10007036_12790 [Alsobacter metallidurans]|uniref:PhiE125 gp8 family phage protein n=1 Tax=Alsobacter metallidurans TaxID=340221 RepID=A0A917MHB5_9HYPH|nr:hypothetical protein GCM10007036_12790 [Alsobacter metallidurans]